MASAVLNRYAKLGGNQGGILPGMMVSVAAIDGEPYLRSATASMPAYHRLALDDPHMQMQYHLAGYGESNEEAVTRLTGEAVERYAAIMAMTLFADRLEFASYRALSSRNRCMPLAYLSMFNREQQQALHGMIHRYAAELPTDDDVIAWIACPSLTRPGEDIYVPAQLFFLAFRTNDAYGDKMFVPSFSTGTASHTSLDKALLNALIEAVQIDGYILNWYTESKAPRIRLNAHEQSLLSRSGLQPDGPYDVLATYLTRPEIPLPNIGVTLLRKDKKIPYIAFGLQADREVDRALLRGAAESAAILGIGVFSTIFDLPNVHYAQSTGVFNDLDTNVLYFASPKDAVAKRRVIESRSDGELSLQQVSDYASSDESTIQRLISDISKVSDWATYLDITPPELVDTPWKVVRVLIPELLSMCLPGFPATQHPRMLQYGGVSNVVPHPLP